MFEGIKINKRVALSVLLIFAFMFLLFVMLLTYDPSFINKNIPIISWIGKYHMELMFGTVIFALAVGAAVFYLMQEKIEVKEKESKTNTELFLGFLGADEKKILDYIVKSGGNAYQSEIGRLEGMSRLRAYRAIKKLESKNVLTVEKTGKARKLFLSKSILDALK